MTSRLQHRPPRMAVKFFRWYCRQDRQEELEGDLEETYYRSLNAGKPVAIANILFWWNVLRCFRAYASRRSIFYQGSNNFYSMLTNYLKVIGRNFARQKAYAILNVSGLAIGVAACMLIGIYIHFETSFEQFHKQADRIYRLTVHYTSPSGYDTHFARVDTDWINAIPTEIPEVQRLIRFQNHEPKFVRIGQEKFRQENAFVTDSDVFEVFDFPFVSGDQSTALQAPFSVVISETLAARYFGNEHPLGQEIHIVGYWSTDETAYKVTGVMKDLPPNTHMPVDMLISFRNEAERSWWAYTYLLFQPGTDPTTVSSKIDAMAIKVNGENALDGTEFVLQPLPDIHLHSSLAREVQPNGSAAYVRTFAVVGIAVLALAIINFMNLSSAMAMARAKEIGVRKVLGAAHRQVIGYSFTESFLFSLAATAIGGGMAFLAFPFFRDLTGTEHLLSPVATLSGVVAVCLLAGFFGGVYPAFVLSAFQPANIIRSGKSLATLQRRRGFDIKKGLIMLQFAISILLIGSALVARQQFIFLNEKNLGLSKDQVVAMPGVPDTVKDKFKLFKEALTGLAGIEGVSACLEVPSREIRDGGLVMAEGMHDNADNAPSMDIQVIDHDFIDVMGVELLAGETLPASLTYEPIPPLTGGDDVAEYLISKRRAYILNETALHAIGWQKPEEALGKNIEWSQGTYKLARGPVVGIVKDFHQESLKNKVDPVLMVFEPLWLRTFLVKINTHDVSSTLNTIEGVWSQLFPKYPFEYFFIDELYDNLYKNERQQLHLLYLLSGLAITIAFIGLFGLVAYSLKTKTKEIAIRKVMGASLSSLVRLIGKEYAWVMVMGGAVAVPLSYYLVGRWLEEFAYRIEVGPEWYLVTLGFIGLVLLLTVVFHTVRGASANPAQTLREE